MRLSRPMPCRIHRHFITSLLPPPNIPCTQTHTHNRLSWRRSPVLMRLNFAAKRNDTLLLHICYRKPAGGHLQTHTHTAETQTHTHTRSMLGYMGAWHAEGTLEAMRSQLVRIIKCENNVREFHTVWLLLLHFTCVYYVRIVRASVRSAVAPVTKNEQLMHVLLCVM